MKFFDGLRKVVDEAERAYVEISKEFKEVSQVVGEDLKKAAQEFDKTVADLSEKAAEDIFPPKEEKKPGPKACPRCGKPMVFKSSEETDDVQHIRTLNTTFECVACKVRHDRTETYRVVG